MAQISGIWILTSYETLQFLHRTPRKIGVYLDFARREVTFYDAENMAQISSLSAEFKGKFVPFLHLWSKGSYIKLCPCQR
ncbi:E3 ubiquitin-protein ligase TRIM41 [Chelonia mydas]|uniref:E3 ubiquitin-protein ligase TRIM41 n=1 Tax=Chelonia mydas TaxID=8469 RepID=M7BUP9_CHEMY|nr:E3 ubiquitin-protein ligase TRIM41 [Chelonia mydas]